MSVVIETTIGDVTVDLFLKERPKAALNFLKLCKLKYYNYNLFHTIEHGFIAQTGDPTGNGDGGKSVWGVIEGDHKRYFEGEFVPKIRHTEPGLLSMVGTGENMLGSQFFFTLGPDLASLDGKHCVIGEVTEGHEILRKLNEAICDESHRPYQDIRITHTVILEDPFSDPRGFRQPSRSPSPSAERLKGGRIAADEDIDDMEGKTEAEIAEMLAEREAKARATILEIVGDIPDADIAPPENVLFVCKLNPVTTDDDLQIIFSRFGKIKGCEVIRDKVTGDSLQYAFIEFETQKSCEDAYFKMDNVLIDDRRIHVDFSQSVSKIKWKGKGKGIEHVGGSSKKSLSFNDIDYRNTREWRWRAKSKLRKSTENSRSRSRSLKRRDRSYSRGRRPYYSPRRERNNDRFGRRDNYRGGSRYGSQNQNIIIRTGAYDYRNRPYPNNASERRRASRRRSQSNDRRESSRSYNNDGPRRRGNDRRKSRSYDRRSYSSERRENRPRGSRSPMKMYREKSSLDRIVARGKQRDYRSPYNDKRSPSPDYKRQDDKYYKKSSFSRSPPPKKRSYSREKGPVRRADSRSRSRERSVSVKITRTAKSFTKSVEKVVPKYVEKIVPEKEKKIIKEKSKSKSKKKRSKSTDSEASHASSDSSSDEKSKKRKKKTKKKKSKKSKKYSSSSESDSSSSDSDSSAAAEKKKKSKKKNK